MVQHVQVFAPAKINLCLHITGKRPDGYHFLDSLVAFADIGDLVEVSRSDGFSFGVSGPFSSYFSLRETDPTAASGNIAVRAAQILAEVLGRPLDVRINLTKNLPLASGLGGGSADAAAVIRGLRELWALSETDMDFHALLIRLGADVPVCWRSVPKRVRGVGEILEDAPVFPKVPVVLVNPMKHCVTAAVFKLHKGFSEEVASYPASFADVRDFCVFLEEQRNDLLVAALQVVPEIRACLAALSADNACLLSRLSGSGATCFGIFEDEQGAQNAARSIARSAPHWWVRAGYVG